MSGRLDVDAAGAAVVFMLGAAALMELSHAGLLESDVTEGAAGGLAAGRVGVVGVVVFAVGAVVAAAADAGGGVEDLGLSPAEGDGARTSSTGLFVLLLLCLFSPPFFFPPSPWIPAPRAGKLYSSLSWISTNATFLSSSSLAKRCSSVTPKARSTKLTDFLVAFAPPCSSAVACGGQECCFCTRPLEPGAVTGATEEEDAGTCFPLPLPLPFSSHSPPCPLLSLLSLLTTVLQLLSSLRGRRLNSETCFLLPSSSMCTVTGPLLGGTSLTVAL